MTTTAKLLLVAIAIMSTITSAMAKPKVSYQLAMPEPHTHYFEVTVFVEDWDKPTADFKMATWTPGSYLIREYAKNVEAVGARTAQGSLLAAEKVRKNIWRINTKGVKQFSFNYKVYAYELTVRNAFVDASHAYLNPAAVMMVPAGTENQASTLKIVAPASFKKIATALRPVGSDPFLLQVPDWDTFIDSPIEIGNHDSFDFTTAGVPHHVAIFGGGNYNVERLKKDMAKVVETATAIFGEHPCDHYTFIVHNIPNGGGGLEHKFSTTLQANPFGYADENTYTGFLGLVAHEYFHLWNVKRVRPVALGPFDYDNENYTRGLWVAEGITSYYDDYILLRAGLIKEEKYLDIVAGSAGAVENSPGAKVQTLDESSYDAWIKYYRPNENSNNATVSYYTKGGVVGMLLDLTIRQKSGGKKNLDDVMRTLYRDFYKKANRGFTDAEFEKVCSTVAGADLSGFFNSTIRSTEKLPVQEVLGSVGIEVVDKTAKTRGAAAFLGANLANQNGRWVVTSVVRNSPAWHDDLNVNDEIIALNAYRLTSDWNEILKIFKPGDQIEVTLARAGLMQKRTVKLAANPNVAYKFSRNKSADAAAAALAEAWLKAGN